MRTSKYDAYTKEELQKLIDESNSIREVIIKVGLKANGNGGYLSFNKKAKELGLNITELKKRGSECKTKKLRTYVTANFKIDLKDILVENSDYTNNNGLRHRLIKEGLLKNECSICGQLPSWNDDPLTLHLDHINGTHCDNRLDNLRIVCPHCHSQLATTGSRRLKKEHLCTDCGKEITRQAKLCKSCSNKQPRVRVHTRKFEVTKEDLEELMKTTPMTKIGKQFGVSDNAIRKRAKLLGIDF